MVFVLKLQYEGDIRRVSVEQPLSYAETTDLARSLFGHLPSKVVFKYKDDEGDSITVSTDREMNEAFRFMKGQSVYRFSVVGLQEQDKKPNSPCPFKDLDNLINIDLSSLDFSDVLPTVQNAFESLFKEPQPSSTTTASKGNCCKPQQAKTSSVPVHNGVKCDGCGCSPIRGKRLKCHVCPDYDLCEICDALGVHREHPLSVIATPVDYTSEFCPVRPVPLTAVHHGVTCDGCNTFPLRGIRHKCSSCPNYDLCDSCESKGIHNHHSFTKIIQPRRYCPQTNNTSTNAEVVHFAICDNCQSRIKGIRYKCATCADYDLCQNCSALNIHSHHLFSKIERPCASARWTSCPVPRKSFPQKNSEERTSSKQEANVPHEPTLATTTEPQQVKPEEVQAVDEPKVESPKLEEPQPSIVVPVEEPKKEEQIPVQPVEEPKAEELKVEPPKQEDTKPVVVEAKPIHPFEEKLKQLEDMGFTETQKNIELLVKNNGDMIKTVMDLLS